MNSTQDRGKILQLLKALGNAHYQRGEYAKALRRYRQIAELGFEDAESLRAQALTLAQLGDVGSAAMKVYGRALETNQEDSLLYRTLGRLFIQTETLRDFTLAILIRALRFAGDVRQEILDFITKVFYHTPHFPFVHREVWQFLQSNPEAPQLLNAFLLAVWREKKFQRAIQLLNQLASRSESRHLYRKAILQTILQKKTVAEMQGSRFELTFSEWQHCLRYRSRAEAPRLVRDLEWFLDLRNLFCGPVHRATDFKTQHEEFEFLGDEVLEETDELLIEEPASFDLQNDVLRALTCLSSDGSGEPQQVRGVPELNAVAILEIVDELAPGPKPDYNTFLNLSREALLSTGHPAIVALLDDGLVIFTSQLPPLFSAALHLLKKLERYNRMVELDERISLRITLHAAHPAFTRQKDQGLFELRRAIKLHNLGLPNRWGLRLNVGEAVPPPDTLLLSEPASQLLPGQPKESVGGFQLAHFPFEHKVFQAPWRDLTANVGIHKTFGRYEVQKPLRTTPTQSTFLAEDPQLERSVVLKVFRGEAFRGDATLEATKQRFFEAVRGLSALNDPASGMVYDAGEDGDALFLVREWVGGIPLPTAVGENALPAQQLIDAFVDICRMVYLYHTHDLVHGNLKRNNILFTEQQEIKLLDGGVPLLGDLDPGFDLFCLGMLLYECFTGKSPLPFEDAVVFHSRALEDRPNLLAQLRPQLPEPLHDLVTRAMTPDPAQRFTSTEALGLALQRLSVPHTTRTPHI